MEHTDLLRHLDAFHLLRDAVIAIDDEFRVLFWNQGAELQYGFTAAEAAGKRLEEALGIKNTHPALQKVLEGLKTAGEWHGEIIHYHRDGRTVWMEWRIQRLKWPDIEPWITIGFSHDITDRKRVEQALQESEAQFRAFAENSYDTIMRFDRQCRHLYVNPVVEKQTNIPAAEFLGKTFTELGFPAELAMLWEEAIRSVFKTKKADRIEFQLPKGIWIDWLLIPEKTPDGEVPAVIATARDITEKKKYEMNLRDALRKAKEAEMLKSTFLSYMSHEIRTPLNHIIGLSSIIRMSREDLTDAKIDQYLKIISQSANSLLEIIMTMLDLSKIETGKYAIEEKPFDFHQFVGEIFEKFKVQTAAKSLYFKCDLDQNIPVVLIGDRFNCERVLTNLLSNATKFCREGFVELGIAVKSRTKDCLELRFKVVDSGIGIPADQLEKIFQAFYQVDMSTTREHHGTGLGLTISRELVQMMGGEIWAENKPDKGSVFYFTCVFGLPGDVPASESPVA